MNSPQNMEEPCVMSFTQKKTYLKIVRPSSYYRHCDFSLSDPQKSLINDNIVLYFLFHYWSIYPAREFCGLKSGFSGKFLLIVLQPFNFPSFSILTLSSCCIRHNRCTVLLLPNHIICLLKCSQMIHWTRHKNKYSNLHNT